MLTTQSKLVVASCMIIGGLGGRCSGAAIFESATLGPTGITLSQLQTGEVNGSHLSEVVFPGVRFRVTQHWETSTVGGHFVSSTGGQCFGAIVKLTDATDFPDSENLSTPDVLGVTRINLPNPSAEAYGDLSVLLEPGWYALVFGSGLFHSIGYGGLVNNGSDVGSPSYIGWQPGSGVWHESFYIYDKRLVVEGNPVPEQSGASLAVAALAILVTSSVHRRPETIAGDLARALRKL